MALASDGGYVAVGDTQYVDDSAEDALLFKLNHNGEVLWQRAVGEYDRNDWAEVVKQTPAGTHIVAGVTRSFGEGSSGDRNEIFLLEVDTNGNVLWQRTYGSVFPDNPREDDVNDLIVTTDGGYLLVGSTENSDGQDQGLILKLSDRGEIQWQRRLKFSEDGEETDWRTSWASAVIETSDGGYALTGTTRTGLNGTHDPFLVKLSAAGDLQWGRYYDDPEEGYQYYNDEGYTLIQTRDGGYLLGLRADAGHPYYRDIALLRLSANGLIEWQNLYGSIMKDNDGDEWPVDILEQQDGYLIGLVYRHQFADPAALKISTAGDMLYQKRQYGSHLRRFLATPDGGYVFANEKEILKLDDTFGFGSGPDACPGPTDTNMDQRPANYFVDDTVEISIPSVALMEKNQSMRVTSIDAAGFERTCFDTFLCLRRLEAMLPSIGGWRVILGNP
ncbi:MAG: hypothetical protein C1943_08880 [Halochromatium sp.]|nr:hypothetical protein [Halochromatium sp.]